MRFFIAAPVDDPIGKTLVQDLSPQGTLLRDGLEAQGHTLDLPSNNPDITIMLVLEVKPASTRLVALYQVLKVDKLWREWHVEGPALGYCVDRLLTFFHQSFGEWLHLKEKGPVSPANAMELKQAFKDRL